MPMLGSEATPHISVRSACLSASIIRTDSCQAHHTLYILSGRMHIAMSDGTEFELGPGDAAVIAPGHDAWTVGDEPCVAVDTTGVARYAKRD